MEALKSVESQTYPYYEIIIVDDGSTDSTQHYLSTLKHPFILLRHSGKPGYVRNKGFSAAKGDFITFLDSDDLWKPEKLEMQINFFKTHPDIKLCHTREIWERNGKIISQKTQKHRREGYIFNETLKKCIIGPSTVMLTRDLFTEAGMFHPELEIAEDYELWMRITSHHHVGYIETPLVLKRAGHDDQLSEKYGHIEYFRIKALASVINQELLTVPQQRDAIMEIIKKCRIYTHGCIKRGKFNEACEFMNLMEKFKNKLEKEYFIDND